MLTAWPPPLDCYESLYFDKIDTRMLQVEQALPCTNEWLWENPTFVDWRDRGGVLWISGSPGNGKPVLAKTVVQKLRTTVGFQKTTAAPLLVIAWFYSARLLEKGTSHTSMFRALLYQILANSQAAIEAEAEAVRSTYRRCFDGRKPEIHWDQKSLKEMLIAHAVSPRTPQILAIIDAMDEANDGAREDVLCVLSEMAFTRGSQIRLILLSRPLPNLQAEYIECNQIEMHKCNRRDVDEIIRIKIQQLRDSWPGVGRSHGGAKARFMQAQSVRDHQETVRPPKLGKQAEVELDGIQQYLRKKSQGIILWVLLVFDQIHDLLKNGVYLTREKLYEAVKKLPQKVEELYEDIVVKLKLEDDPGKQDVAKRILLWTTGPPRWEPLQLRHLWDALAIPAAAGPEKTAGQRDGDDNNKTDSSPLDRGRLIIQRDDGCTMDSYDWALFYESLHNYCGALVTIRPPGPPGAGVAAAAAAASAASTEPDHNNASDVSQLVQRVDGVKGDWTVHIVHQTAKAFLEDPARSGPLHVASSAAAQDFIRAQCQQYLDLVFPVANTRYTPFISPAMFETIGGLDIKDINKIRPLDENKTSRDRALGVLNSFMGFPDTVKKELQRLGDYLGSHPMSGYAFKVLASDSSSLTAWSKARLETVTTTESRQGPFFLWWFVQEPPIAQTTQVLAYLTSYLCRSGACAGLQALLGIHTTVQGRGRVKLEKSIRQGFLCGALNA